MNVTHKEFADSLRAVAQWIENHPEIAAGYHSLRWVNGHLCGVQRQLYTVGFIVGLTDDGYQRRYCYERREDAIHALLAWDGKGDPPGPWIKSKPDDRLGPGARE